MNIFVLLASLSTFFFVSYLAKHTVAPHSAKRMNYWLLAGLTLLVIGSMTLGSSKTEAATKKETPKTEVKTKKTSSSDTANKKQKFKLVVPAEIEADANDSAEIKGKTSPNAKIHFAKKETSKTIKADKKGNFKLVYHLTTDQAKKIKLIATSNHQKKTTTVTIQPNAKKVAEKAQQLEAQKQAEAQRQAEAQAAEAQRQAEAQAAAQEAQRQTEAQRQAEAQAAEAQRQAEAVNQTPQQTPNAGITGYCKDGAPASGDPSARGKANSCYGHGGWVR